MPQFPLRSVTLTGDARAPHNTANVYFDQPYEIGGNVATKADGSALIPRDTYCYVVYSGDTHDDFGTFDVSEASFSYTYWFDNDGKVISATLQDGKYVAPADYKTQVMVFGYEDDIAYSGERIENGTTVASPNYAAVSMSAGSLNINIEAKTGDASTTSRVGSFYSYFGTWHTSCIYITGGDMTVSTSGEMSVVNPDDLPDIVQKTDSNKFTETDTNANSAKFGEGVCILSDGGTLDIRRIASLKSYNGSAISVSGGMVTMRNTSITKFATVSHADDPFSVADEVPEGGGPSEFPARRQYRDAAVFLNGGALDISDSAITVKKDIAEGVSKKRTDGAYRTTFGILSRGRTSSSTMSQMDGRNITVSMTSPDSDKSKASDSFAVSGTRGTIELTGGSITCESDQRSYGVYAVNKGTDGRAVQIILDDTDINIGKKEEYGKGPLRTVGSDGLLSVEHGARVPTGLDANNKRVASVAVYLDSQIEGGSVIVKNNATIHTQEMGIAVNGGNLTFDGGTNITAYNASAVCLVGGKITFNESVNPYNIDCRINRQDYGTDSSDNCTFSTTVDPSSDCKAYTARSKAAGAHQYDIYLPWQQEAGFEGDSLIYDNFNGIRVEGGTFNCLGKLNMAFRGLYNDFDQYKFPLDSNGNASVSDTSYINFDRVVIKSFAVACVQPEQERETVDAQIYIKTADIRTTVGGGIKVAGTENAKVTLGDANSQSDDIKVHTMGRVHFVTPYPVAGKYATSVYNAWHFYPNLSGGHAVISRGGSVEVWNGKYTSDFCNGIAASNDTAHASEVMIHGGTFTGNLTHKSTPVFSTNGGPASFYGLKVMGKSNVDIYGGVFDGKNGGAFVRGNSDVDIAVVKIYEGQFGSSENPDVEHASGQDSYNVYEYSTVYFGAYTNEELNDNGYDTDGERQNLIKAYANLSPIAVNSINSEGNTNVYVYYGYYYTRSQTITRADGSKATIPVAIAALDDNMTKLNMFIYGFGTNVFKQTNLTTYANGRIRNGQYANKANTITKQYYSYTTQPTDNLFVQ